MTQTDLCICQNISKYVEKMRNFCQFFDENFFCPDHLLFQEKNNVQFAQKESGKIQMTGERYMKNKQEKVL
ncbi:hypothetical protein H8R94_02270 [Roseburia sp. NSJ-9]|uniref:Uncharacterized protein n=1 Tax=Roseburia lenta TaxID=2763061 RepID=A0ABR7GDE0_9FIRM|nr:hypothetical protein [Roseburia lenta]MBC5685448.1 hypothetical protein [Roseburia lenta]